MSPRFRPKSYRSLLAAATLLPAMFAGVSLAVAETDPASYPGALPGERLGGLLPLTERLLERWCWSGAWLYPIGDPHALGLPGPDGDPGYAINRGMGPAEDGSFHQGADLCNHRAGGIVRAAAGGIVVRVARETSNGYGVHVVLAHRFADSLAYSLYAHLLPGSVRVAEGATVSAGQPLGRVGRSGRASTDHLHFEVRLPDDPTVRWEKATPLDPIGFVAARLAAAGHDTTWDSAYLEWAECAGLLAGGRMPDQEPLTRRAWSTMLGRAARDPESFGADVWSRDEIASPGARADEAPVGWREMARDLAHLDRGGVRLPRCLVASDRHRRTCRSRLDRERPSRSLKQLAKRSGDPPTLSDACLVLADLVVGADRKAAAPTTTRTRAKAVADSTQAPVDGARATR
jgi:murein DD-endopeptidase MepM/ murein hydrolase activator NlpD